jgi:hypothetical protein
LGAAVGQWRGAALAFDGTLTNCGRHLSPMRDFFATCMKQPPLGYVAAANAVRREFGAACSKSSAQAGGILTRDLGLFRREIAVADEAANAAFDRRPRHGPAPVPFQERAWQTVTRDLARLDHLARC